MTTPSPSRVHRSHTIARLAFRLAGLFGIVAGIWAVVVLIRGGSWWGPLHAFAAGTVLAAISGASQMFTITWSAASPPPPALTSAQRRLLGVGVALVLIGVGAGFDGAIWVGALAVVAALVLLGWSLTSTVRRSLLRRFDLSARFYLLAVAAGVVGVTLGAMLGSGVAGDSFMSMRLVHSHLNLVGLVGLTIVGTLPTFLPTVAHHRAVSGREAIIAWWLAGAGSAAMVAGLWWGAPPVGAGTIAVGLSATLILSGILWRLWQRGRQKLPFLQVAAGTSWLIVWSIVDGIRLLSDQTAVPWSQWTAVAIVAGVGQVLLGSLAYLLPVLAGPPLEPNASRMTSRPALPLFLANAAGLAGALGATAVLAGCAVVLVLDFALRLAVLTNGGTVILKGGRHCPDGRATSRPARRG
jgi:nitrite reductase (NO-forming)